MGIRTIVTFDEGVLAKVREISRTRGISLSETVNQLLRTALTNEAIQSTEAFRVKPIALGYRPELNYDCTEALLEYAEGPFHR